MNAPYHNKALPEGTVLREWRLEQVLGVGGFGIVYRGKDVYFGETVAIKEYFPGAISDRVDGVTVAPTDSSSEEVYELGRKKFLEEAKVLWNLSQPKRHPNIVGVRSLFEIHGTAYMVMDFESGLSLSEMLHGGQKFDEKSLLAIIKPIAEGLDRAHRAGVLHRDIKPANILISKGERPVLIDFGSARFESGQATNTKVTFYTPPYAAIEQYVKTFPQGAWTDIYALGVVLYQCVTGEKPPEVLERLHGGLGQSLSARQWPGFSRAFTRAVDAAMAIRPQERPHSIPHWLKLFELDGDAREDESTRIGTLAAAEASVSAGPVTVTAAKPVAARPVANTAKPAQRAPQKKPSRGVKPAIIGSLAAVATVALVLFLLMPGHRPATEPPAAVAANNTAVDDRQTNLSKSMDGLLAAASKVGRRPGEISDLTKAKENILSLAAQKGSVQAMDAAAGDMAKNEIAILGRATRRMWRDLDGPPDTGNAPDAANILVKLKTAKADMDARLSTDLTGLDAGAAIEATRQTLLGFGTFQDAYSAAAPFYVSARRKAFGDLYVSVQSTSDQIVALAAVPKPWFLAPQARKQAYQLRQDNAAQAKALVAQLSSLSGIIPTTGDLKQLNAAMAQAVAAQTTLSSLHAVSSAAKP
ncbi:MAG TPA: protein kinase [Rhizomicrobium sp.]|nr:protein kinase [Rhizomicrobium sp.]